MRALPPIPDNQAFADLIVDSDIYVLPGHVAEPPGCFRISLTANDDMVARSLDGFGAAREKAVTG
jgi:aspartate aminotransferase